MRATFVNPPYAFAPEEKASTEALDPVTVDVSTFPVGLAILAAIAERRGDTVTVVEMPFMTEIAAVAAIIESRPDACWR